jgi:mycothiol synthase
MITVEFRDELEPAEAAELAAMIAEAAAYDEEAGFSTASPNVGDSDAEVEVFQMVARLTPGMHGSADTPLVAFLRLDVDRSGAAIAQMIVRRGYRSLGIGTLMVERLAERAGPGFAGTGAISVTTWAHGSHPAADRMARRFGAAESRIRWRLLRGAEVRYVDPEDEAAVLAARRDGFVHEHTDVCYVWRVPVPLPSDGRNAGRLQGPA